MTDIYGTVDFYAIFDEIYVISFSLPDTLTPKDWVVFLKNRLEEKRPEYAKGFNKLSEYHYSTAADENEKKLNL